jgi:hypothetical protein
MNMKALFLIKRSLALVLVTGLAPNLALSQSKTVGSFKAPIKSDFSKPSIQGFDTLKNTNLTSLKETKKFKVALEMLKSRRGGTGVDGGGGNICMLTPDSEPTLLDLVPAKNTPLNLSQAAGEKVILTKFLNEAGFMSLSPVYSNEPDTFYTSRLKNEVERILSSGLQSSPVTARFISEFLNHSQFFGVNTKLNKSYGADYSKAPECSRGNTRAVIYNIAGAAIFIEVGLWNEMSLGQQATTLIHEGFRFIQSMVTNPPSNKDVQNLVLDIAQGKMIINLDEVFDYRDNQDSTFLLSSDPSLSMWVKTFDDMKFAGWKLAWHLHTLEKYMFEEKENMFILNPKRQRYNKLLSNLHQAVLTGIAAGIQSGSLATSNIFEFYMSKIE